MARVDALVGADCAGSRTIFWLLAFAKNGLSNGPKETHFEGVLSAGGHLESVGRRWVGVRMLMVVVMMMMVVL